MEDKGQIDDLWKEDKVAIAVMGAMH